MTIINKDTIIAEIERRISMFSAEKAKESASVNDKLSLVGRIAALQELLVFVNEKQGEQKPVDKTPLKFKIGDWVVNKFGDVWHIDSFDSKNYQVSNGDKYCYFPIKKQDKMHLWTIQDAKDRDVLTNGEIILIFKQFEEPAYRERIIAYIGLDISGNIQVTDGYWQFGTDKAIPATKEQRDLLFAKMKEVSYEWDTKNKVLKKMN